MSTGTLHDPSHRYDPGQRNDAYGARTYAADTYGSAADDAGRLLLVPVSGGIYGVSRLAEALNGHMHVGRIGPWHVQGWEDWRRRAVWIEFDRPSDARFIRLRLEEGELTDVTNGPPTPVAFREGVAGPSRGGFDARTWFLLAMGVIVLGGFARTGVRQYRRAQQRRPIPRNRALVPVEPETPVVTVPGREGVDPMDVPPTW
ncbi:MAG TPA: hypothetical protein VED40_16715 [Azospirillaceae bacterium]|nr:hypothetical protein [Azospirillaceae bacterium]